MTYDKQDLLLDLRKLAVKENEHDDGVDDPEEAHHAADKALLRFIDDEHVTTAWDAIQPKWYS